MQIGVDADALATFSGTLKRLMQVDPRGGYFLQSDVELAIKRCAIKEAHSTMRDGWCKLNEYTHEEGYKNSAYVVRVMLSHVRNKADDFNKLGASGQAKARESSHPQELRDIYNVIDVDKGAASVRKTRPHPLPAFRAAQDASSEEEVVPVLKRFDVSTGESYLVMSDGSREMAKFKCGEQGRLVATWPEYNMELQLELPNSALKDDGAIDYTPADPRKPPKAGHKTKKGKPASARKRPAGAVENRAPPTAPKAKAKTTPKAKAKTTPTPTAAATPSRIQEKIRQNIDRISEEARSGLQGFAGRDSNELATCYAVAVDGGTISLRDLHRSPCFYVDRVTEIPENFPGLGDDAVVAMFEGKKLNKKGGVQFGFGDDADLAFKAAKLLRPAIDNAATDIMNYMPPVPAHVVMLHCPRVIMANGEFRNTSDRRMEWSPVRVRGSEVRGQRLCLQCGFTVTGTDVNNIAVERLPICPMHGHRVYVLDHLENTSFYSCASRAHDDQADPAVFECPFDYATQHPFVLQPAPAPIEVIQPDPEPIEVTDEEEDAMSQDSLITVPDPGEEDEDVARLRSIMEGSWEPDSPASSMFEDSVARLVEIFSSS
ncbi:unnamed protein product [Prorocentrum cordatum]|uniref:Uncharacterized protein n=1 Tax=Prorocentrum cordatum TaxID=2364126 RepID=A0ABN9TWV7_9DINO|nr:unnamed protein product [Polarella glacialis]